MRPRLYTVPSSADFIATLADAILNNAILHDWPRQGDPLSLAEGTILLPTQRAARALAEALSAQLGGGAILPRITPLGDVDEAEDALLLAEGGFGEDFTELPAITETERRLVLAKLIQKWSDQVRHAIKAEGPRNALERAFTTDEGGFRVASSTADTLALATALGRLIDTLAIHDVQWSDVHKLVPTDHDEYWDISRKFLTIAAEQWPRHCADNNYMDAALRRHRVLNKEAHRLTREKPNAPLIAAGSTGSMPATAHLLKAIAALPHGAVVLPGLDQILDDASYKFIADEPTHPQALLARLIQQIGVKRREIVPLTPSHPRDALASTALRPAETTNLWADANLKLAPETIHAALDTVTLIEAQDDREEALAIAIALRETLEIPDQTAALVTPDRDLAERVTAELRRWDVSIIDTAGQPLDKSEAGAFALLAAEIVARDWDAQTLLALLHHPFFRFGLGDEVRARAIATLDMGVLRGRAPLQGINALIATAEEAQHEDVYRAPRPRKRLSETDWDVCLAMLARLRACFAPLALPSAPPNLWAQALTDCLDALSRDEAGTPCAFERSDGAMLAALLQEMAQSRHGDPVKRRDLPQTLAGLMQGRSALAPGRPHPRLQILGLIEARLVRADRMILGGLDESVWPPDTRTDPFLNRAMRQQLKLPAPEKRVGQTAHDFVSAFGAEHVVLTRANKRAGKPTVPSRLLLRLEAVAGAALNDVRKRGQFYLDAARLLDEADAPGAPPLPDKIKAPRISVDPALVPRDYRITEIEKLIRDPYAIFAKRILELDPLQPVAMPPGAAERGTLIHEVIGDFAKAHPIKLPPDARAQLLEAGDKLFAAYAAYPDVAAFWRPRFEAIVDYYLDWEEERRKSTKRVIAETDGRLAIDHDEVGPIVLRGRADRIEILKDGTLAIVDFKTGNPPGTKEVQLGKNPQLTLEAAMAAQGAFTDVPKADASELVYVKLKGDAALNDERHIEDEDNDAMDLADDHLARVVALIAEYCRGERPFLSRVHMKKAGDQSDYDHLARVREWSTSGESDA
jgi:ATP-dependent helicase/nuclease subunit B